jgi:hypothetical protein
MSATASVAGAATTLARWISEHGVGMRGLFARRFGGK